MKYAAARSRTPHTGRSSRPRAARFLLPLVASLLAVLLVPRGAARADEWLTFRHDARRTGASAGRCDLARPAVGWRRYVGGAISRVIAYDVDRDGNNEIVFASGGRVLARRPDDTVVWESPLVGGVTLLGVVDIDRDGADELLAATLGGPDVFLIALRDGAVRWRGGGAPEFQAVGSVRLADLDGDGRDDLYVADCGCCTLNGSLIAAAYSFAAPATIATPRRLWTLGPEGAGCGHAYDQVGDVDGDGAPEVIVTNRQAEFNVFDGRTGRHRARVPAPASGEFYPETVAHLRNLDADPALELVVVSNGYAASVGGARRVAVYDWTGTAFAQLWEQAGTDRPNDTVQFEPDGAAVDLDGDMALETVYSLTTASGPTLYVRDARSGVMRASRAGAALRGIADLDGDGRAELLVRQGADLRAVAYGAGGTLADRWTLNARAPLRQVDPARLIRRADATVTLALQFDEDPALELVLVDDAGTTLTAYDADGAAPRMIGSFAAGAGISFLLSASVGQVSRPYPQLATVLSDGYLLVMDRAMRPTNRVIDAEFRFLGMRVGGYVTPTLRVAQLPGGPAVLTSESRGALVRLDARMSSLAAPPRVVWERGRAREPLIADLDGDGAREVAVVEGRDVVALDGATAARELWRVTELPMNGGLLGDLLPFTRRGSTRTDVYFVASDPGVVFHARALRGTDGSSLWPGYTRAICCGFVPVSVADLDADGVDDMVAVNNSAFSVSGADGTLLRNDPTGSIYSLPMVGDMAGDGATSVWIHGGFNVDRLLDANLATRATRADRAGPNTGAYGARVECGGAPAVVEATFQSNLVFTLRPRDASLITSVALADGEVYAPGMVPATATRVGHAGVATAVADLDGRGTPAVLVNSTDGFLYALEPCTLRKIWSLDFRYATGEPVVGDTDGDGRDEVLLGCADGNLYRLANAAYGSPAPVLDTDPPAGLNAEDVDEIATIGTLYAAWTAVPGATAYEVAVLTAAGTAVTNPVYRDVGDVTRAAFPGLPLRRDQRYVVSVRPTGPMGTGIEALSDGVTVREPTAPTVDVVVNPARFWPPAGQRALVQATLRSRTRNGLARWRAHIEQMDGSVVRVLEERVVHGEMIEVRVPWDGIEAGGVSVPAGRYRAVVVARGSMAGLIGTGSAEVFVDPAAAQMTGPDAGGPARDAGMDGGRPGAGGGGCGCRAVAAREGGERGGAWALAALAIAGAAMARRRRRE